MCHHLTPFGCLATNYVINEDRTCLIGLLVVVGIILESFSSIGVTETEINRGHNGPPPGKNSKNLPGLNRAK